MKNTQILFKSNHILFEHTYFYLKPIKHKKLIRSNITNSENPVIRNQINTRVNPKPDKVLDQLSLSNENVVITACEKELGDKSVPYAEKMIGRLLGGKDPEMERIKKLSGL